SEQLRLRHARLRAAALQFRRRVLAVPRALVAVGQDGAACRGARVLRERRLVLHDDRRHLLPLAAVTLKTREGRTYGSPLAARRSVTGLRRRTGPRFRELL